MNGPIVDPTSDLGRGESLESVRLDCRLPVPTLPSATTHRPNGYAQRRWVVQLKSIDEPLPGSAHLCPIPEQPAVDRAVVPAFPLK